MPSYSSKLISSIINLTDLKLLKEKVDLFSLLVDDRNSPFEINEQQDLIKIVNFDIILVKIINRVSQKS